MTAELRERLGWFAGAVGSGLVAVCLIASWTHAVGLFAAFPNYPYHSQIGFLLATWIALVTIHSVFFGRTGHTMDAIPENEEDRDYYQEERDVKTRADVRDALNRIGGSEMTADMLAILAPGLQVEGGEKADLVHAATLAYQSDKAGYLFAVVKLANGKFAAVWQGHAVIEADADDLPLNGYERSLLAVAPAAPVPAPK